MQKDRNGNKIVKLLHFPYEYTEYNVQGCFIFVKITDDAICDSWTTEHVLKILYAKQST